MAFDMLSIPAISDEPERVFSRLGLMITKRRNHLKQSTIQAAQCLHSWDKAKIINIRKTTISYNVLDHRSGQITETAKNSLARPRHPHHNISQLPHLILL